MFKKLSSRKKDKGSKKGETPVSGAAVPYKEPGESVNGALSEISSMRGSPFQKGMAQVKMRIKGSDGAECDPETWSRMIDAIDKGDLDGLRKALKTDNVDINSTDETGETPLHRAAAAGKSKIVRYLLLHGADIEAKNARGNNSLFTAVDHGHTGTVGVLVDYMHSVDSRPREPFVLVRSRKPRHNSYTVEMVHKALELKPFHKRGLDLLQIFISHGQRAEDLAVFLYSVLDVCVSHAFFINTQGDMNMKNFQRFESKAKSQSVTVLNTYVRSMEAVNYEHLRSLILVSCDLTSLKLAGLQNLELLDVRYNRLHSLPENLRDCKSLKTIKCAHNHIRRLPSELSEVSNLMALDCSYNHLKRLTSRIVKCTEMRYLQCDHNNLIELPVDIGMLLLLEDLIVNNNKISHLPLSVSTLTKLRRISFHSNPLLNIPVDFPERAAEVQEYLQSLQDDPVPNTTVKLVLVGQEGVGKTTLLKALKRTFWMIPRSPNTPKTDGIDIKEIKLEDLSMRCFDCGGDVDFNETHNFFITQGALYLACFNLSEYCLSTVERSSFLLGRLQLWLQYIFSRVPSAQVIIVGTHADHEALTKPIFEQIWEQLRMLLVTAREHHRQFFKGSDRLCDCLLCQSDSRCLRRTSGTGTSGFVNLGYDDSASLGDNSSISDLQTCVVSFPHIVGYYEVSSIKSMGNESILQMNQNLSIQHLKEAIKEISKRLIQQNPEIPRKWSDVHESIQNHTEMNPDNSVATIDEVAVMAKAQGVTSRAELMNMLHFFKAQGHLLFFPQLENLEDMVILDPEWLAKIFASVVSFKDTGISDEGFIDRDELKDTWTNIDPALGENILKLLRHFGLCLPVQDSNLELFPCKLPLGEPDESAWPRTPQRGDRQITYSVTFASIIPPPFFGNLMVAVYRNRVSSMSARNSTPHYYSNIILDCMRLDKMGCWHCQQRPESTKNVDDKLLVHRVLIELIPYKRTIQVTVRGPMPCCLMKKVGRILNRVVRNFEGLGSIELDTIVCPGCWLQKHMSPHKFSVKYLATEHKRGEKVYCANAHILPDPKALLCGIINETCMPNATVKPKHSAEALDYSGCPKLFILLPVNKDGMSFDRDYQLYASSLVFDGYAAHLLCEFPDGYHLTRSPGYRLKNPKDFMQSYGSHIICVLRMLSHVAESSVTPQYSSHTKAVTRTIEDILRDYFTRFRGIKDISTKMAPGELHQHIIEQGKKFRREDLRKAFHIMDRPDSFGPLRRLKYGDNLLWLCNDHYRQLRVLSIGANGVQATVESKA